MRKDLSYYKVVEKEGSYKGLNYNVKIMRAGHRCGYVVMPEHIVLSKKDFSYDSDFRVHGGITYAELENDSQVIGFDMNHWKDAPDIEEANKHFTYTVFEKKLHERIKAMYADETIRSLKYVEQECKNLIDQILIKYAGK